MSIAHTFPVFKPDQVLTNQHLNDLFNYLDQQDRLTRSKLIGSGIVCGLDISVVPGAISISKGCGVTTQGYLITFCDHTVEEAYKYYMPYQRPAFPNDLQLISQCGPEPDRSNIPFYASASGNNSADNSLLQLLTQTEFDALADKTGVLPLSQGANIQDYVVVLFLDAGESDLKNCDTNDCNDKGSRMDMDVIPLLVAKKLLGTGKGDGSGAGTFQGVRLRRYNVPVKNLNTSEAVLNAFAALLDDGTLQRVASDLQACFNDYGSLLPGINSNPFGSAADLKKGLLFILKTRPILVQYYYDFIYDLIAALIEFRKKAHTITSECCGDEMKFAFYLALGEASANTSDNSHSAYRQYFIYSPLFDPQSGASNELRSLLMRLVLMYQGYVFTQKILTENKLQLPVQVKITPSNYGRHYLSDRCIPYYYRVVAEKGLALPGDLYQYWNFDKTSHGNARYNLCYNAAAYTNNDQVLNPLYYDIEWYNFYRVEGHIGKNINTALTAVKTIQQEFNLPFEVVALSADYIGALVKGEEPQCNILDLESAYRVLIAEFICQLHPVFCYVAKLAFTVNTGVFTTGGLAGEKSATSTPKKSAAAKKTAAAAEKLVAATKLIDPSRIEINVDHPFVSTLVNEFQATQGYQKGDTLMRLCSPAANTIGSAYAKIIADNKGDFVNPIPASVDNALATLYRNFFNFIDSAETMFKMLMTESLADIESSSFKIIYNKFETEVKLANIAMLGYFKNLDNNENIPDFTVDYLMDVFVDNVQMMLNTCMVEKLDALKAEYTRRLAQYRLAQNFNYYFRKHGGLEHKAGVPRGGTFILVYHEERRNRFVDLHSLFINKELSNVLLSNFKELLSNDIKPGTLEAKAKMLAVSTLYNDPALYLRFKSVLQQYLDDCKDLPDDKRGQLTDIINRPPETNNFQLEDGQVIADFYVPYLCCSDCPPIAYILQPVPDDTKDPQVSIDPKEFCNSDKTAYPIHVNPAGGIVSGQGVKQNNDGSFSFSAAAVAPGNYTLTYTVGGKSASVTVEVLANPVAGFDASVTIDQQNQAVVKFTNTSTHAQSFEWDFGDGQVSTEKDPTHIYPPGIAGALVSLVASNKVICKDAFSKDILLQSQTQQKALSVCRSVKQFLLEPGLDPAAVVKVLSNDGIKMKEATLTILPSSTPINQTTVFHVSYQVNGQQTDIIITIVVPPLDFNITISEVVLGNQSLIGLVLESKDKNYDRQEWKLEPAPIAGTGAPLTDDPLKNIALSTAAVKELGRISISHIVMVKTDNGECENTASFDITNLSKALEKGSFDNHFEF